MIYSFSVRSSLKKMKRIKAEWSDGIVTEILSDLRDFGSDRFAEGINVICNSGDLLESLTKSIFVKSPR